ncbi:hypothetical protein PLICRDRAFT_33270, partial [Plicaturopsis crispa FD-325 SS-3]
IQPPGYWHEVYTPVKSIISGGHFLSYDSLHLTEHCRAFASVFALTSTNADHPGVDRALSRMSIALPIVLQDRDIPLRALAALHRMLHNRSDYQSRLGSKDEPHKHNKLYLSRDDSLSLSLEDTADLDIARKVMDRILSATNLSEEELHDIVERAGPAWCAPGTVSLTSEHARPALPLIDLII